MKLPYLKIFIIYRVFININGYRLTSAWNNEYANFSNGEIIITEDNENMYAKMYPNSTLTKACSLDILNIGTYTLSFSVKLWIAIPLIFLRIFDATLSPLFLPNKRSVCVGSPVTTILELIPKMLRFFWNLYCKGDFKKETGYYEQSTMQPAKGHARF